MPKASALIEACCQGIVAGGAADPVEEDEEADSPSTQGSPACSAPGRKAPPTADQRPDDPEAAGDPAHAGALVGRFGEAAGIEGDFELGGRHVGQ